MYDKYNEYAGTHQLAQFLNYRRSHSAHVPASILQID